MRWLQDLVRRAGRDANVSRAINVAETKGARTSASSHQRIVQRNGETTVTTVTTERHVEQEEHTDDREA